MLQKAEGDAKPLHECHREALSAEAAAGGRTAYPRAEGSHRSGSPSQALELVYRVLAGAPDLAWGSARAGR